MDWTRVGVALDVGVVDAEDHGSVVVAGIEPVEDERAGAADVQKPCGRRREADANISSLLRESNRTSCSCVPFTMLASAPLEPECSRLRRIGRLRRWRRWRWPSGLRRGHDLPLGKCQHIQQDQRAKRRNQAQQAKPRRKSGLFTDEPAGNHHRQRSDDNQDGNNCRHRNHDSQLLDRLLIWLLLQKQCNADAYNTPRMESRLCAKLRSKSDFRNHFILPGDAEHWRIVRLFAGAGSTGGLVSES